VRTLASWTINRGGAPQTIELPHGDLIDLPPEHAVDIVVVSALPNDYSFDAGLGDRRVRAARHLGCRAGDGQAGRSAQRLLLLAVAAGPDDERSGPDSVH
jgi:hypothetical protein